jgi:hypothetical protein
MTAHSLSEKRSQRADHRTRSQVVQLGWPHFWLLAGILGGMLGLVALLFFASLAL